MMDADKLAALSDAELKHLIATQYTHKERVARGLETPDGAVLALTAAEAEWERRERPCPCGFNTALAAALEAWDRQKEER